MYIYWIDDMALMYKTGEEKGVLTSVVVFHICRGIGRTDCHSPFIELSEFTDTYTCEIQGAL